MFSQAIRRAVASAPAGSRTAATATAKRTWAPYKRAATGAPTATASPSAAAATSTPSVTESYDEPTRVQDEQYEANDVPAEMDAPPPAQPAPSLAASTGVTPFAQSAFPSAAGFPSSPTPVVTAAQEVIYAQQQAAMDWATSFHGISSAPFSEKAAETLMRPLTPAEIEIKPDGLLYLPEILYRRILNKAFGPGGWGMVPRGEMTVSKGMVSREWGLWVGGRLVSIARGEQTYFDPSGLPTATEGCKSNALMRCCKDLGIASELWDPAFIRGFKATYCVEAWTEHVSTKKKQKRWRKKGNKFEYPLKEAST